MRVGPRMASQVMFAADTVDISGGSFSITSTHGDPLDKLKHVSSAGILALDDDGCMDGTRVSLLKGLQQWSMDLTTPPIFWLDGMAGTGKSAIARSFCRYLHETHQLGGCFFCLRGHESRATVKRILPTIAWFLTRQDSQYKTTLLEILRDAPDVADYAIKRQVEFLLEKPLHNLSVNPQCPPLVLAIDALDECTDAEEVEQLLNKLFSICKDLPVKFFLTSRPERHIVAHFESSQPEFHRILRLHDIEQDLVEADILLYLTRQLENIRSSRRSSMFPPLWPFPRDLDILTHLSGKLFIYAFTAVKYIAAKNHVKRLQTLTRLTVEAGQPFYRPLDKMYSLVLSAALDPNECTSEEIRMTRRILGTIIAVREPLHLRDLARLIVVEPDDIWENTDRIRAIVNVPASGTDGVVSTFHASFVDFLTTSERAPENMRITLSTAHCDLANCCLKTMNSSLRFNISNCKTSHLLNSEQILTTVPAHLKYASLHWAHHLDAADDAASLLPHLENFLLEKFLFWLEVLSASGVGSQVSSIISRALRSDTARRVMTKNLLTFLHDANQFAVAFRQIIETSVAHIYLSALPSVHKTSKIAEVFMPKYPSLIRVTPQGIQQQRTPLLEMRGHSNSISSVDLSPEGTNIVSGSWDNTIRIWDGRTGEEVAKPLKGHTDAVSSVAFSANGTLIVSGSWDKTIRLWDARTGKAVMKPLKGHTEGVSAVGFSPNGIHIVSGSFDRTIRLWDASTGEEVVKPLKGHTDEVSAVSFSPNGTLIASGSTDKTIRIWDAGTGEEVIKHLKGHTSGVSSVTFSPDGDHIASGSRDKTIRIWDTRTGEEVMKPLKGHANSIVSVGFSADGTHIVSGSWDKTIRIWDARTGREVVKPPMEHTSIVSSVGYFPNGNHIVSGSWDKTIRLWDTTTGLGVDSDSEVIKPLKGHTDSITSVTFSPHGTHIVSGSWDKTVRLWDATTGEEVMEPLKGHTSGVSSVTFSPDGDHIASGSRDKTIRIWDVRTGEEVMKPLYQDVISVGFSPDATRIVSGSWDATILIWNAETGYELMRPLYGHMAAVRSVIFSPNADHIVSGSDDSTIRLWDARTGKKVMNPLKGHTEGVSTVGFSPNGTHIVSGSFDKTIRLWDARTGKEVMGPLEGHTEGVSSVSFSPNGAHIVSGSLDKTIRIWDARTGEEVIEPLKGHTASVNSVEFSPNGAHIVSGSQDKMIRVWDVILGDGATRHLKRHTISPNMWSIVTPESKTASVLPKLQSDDGWIRGSHQEHILWVLPEWRKFVQWHPCILVIGQPAVYLDPLHFVRGFEWIRCVSNS